MKQMIRFFAVPALATLLLPAVLFGTSLIYGDKIYNPGHLKPIDSRLKVAEGQMAPDFTLTAVSGKTVSLSDFKGKQNVLISFVPAAWTPVCSDQWPGYNLARPLFEKRHTTLLGITTDNIPTLFSWTREMGDLWFEVLSDFWPHGKTADTYGVLRGDGTAERALILVDKEGIIRWIHVSDINVRPELGMIMKALEGLEL
ncbi:MAG: peroxiredoxin [Desulfobacterales bacterium]|nr:peroxiredoxin [Desulfobacterales bacterium]